MTAITNAEDLLQSKGRFPLQSRYWLSLDKKIRIKNQDNYNYATNFLKQYKYNYDTNFRHVIKCVLTLVIKLHDLF